MKITSDSHLDHGLTEAQVSHLSSLFGDRDAFFIETVELPSELGTVPCGLHGPLMGDEPVTDSEVEMVERGGRGYPSRLCGRPTRPTSKVTVIAGPHEGESCVLYTAFGGPLAPKEPGDATLSDEQRAESKTFWAQHALSK